MTIKAYGAHAGNLPLEPIDIARRAPGAHDVKIDIAYCGVCHSDLHQVRAEWAGTRYPCVPGHEIVGTVTAVNGASPHQLVMLLFDGAIAAVLQARHAIAMGDLDTKRTTISKAMRIIDEGLRASLETHGDPSLSANLGALYEHMVSRLFKANLKSTDEPLEEVARLLGDLRATWAEISPKLPDRPTNLQA